MEWDFVALAVDLRRGCGKDQFFLFGRRIQDELRAVNIRFDRAHRAFYNQPNANRSGQMENYIAFIHHFGQKMLIHDGIENVMETIVFLEVPDIFHATRGKVVEDKNFITARDQRLCQMRTDKTSTACY